MDKQLNRISTIYRKQDTVGRSSESSLRITNPKIKTPLHKVESSDWNSGKGGGQLIASSKCEF